MDLGISRKFWAIFGQLNSYFNCFIKTLLAALLFAARDSAASRQFLNYTAASQLNYFPDAE